MTIQHIRDVFYRMGFNDREIVALCGAHALGRCHTDRSGYWGPWTFSGGFFKNVDDDVYFLLFLMCVLSDIHIGITFAYIYTSIHLYT